MRRWLPILLTLLVACAGPSSNEVPLGFVAPAAFGRTLTLTQQITVVAMGETRSFEAVVAIDPERVDLAALAMGRRMIAVHLDASGLREDRSPLLPDAVSGARILRDLQLAYWPREALAAALPAGWTVEEGERSRDVLLNGASILHIEYSGEPRWRGRTTLEHRRFGYRLTIESDEA